MSLYYKQEFVSANAVMARVKEELSSYFNSGAIDDVLFPVWIDDCLKRFKKSSLKISEAVIPIEGYQACLPDDFNSVREAWVCAVTWSDPIQNPSSCYYQTDCRIDLGDTTACDPCFPQEDSCNTTYYVTNKVTNSFVLKFNHTFLLRPGNMSARNCCGEHSKNLYSDSPFTFDIQNGKMITNFEDGTLHLLYYANPSTDENQMIPDNFRVQDYIRKYLIYMCFKQLSNQITDETFNQIQLKQQQAKLEMSEALVEAKNELMSQTAEESIRRIGYNMKTFRNRYRL